jgi:FtsZ-binding cell division protein ZapB
MSSPAPEQDSLFDLEERIRRTVDLVSALRAERDSAFAQRDAALAERDEARHSTSATSSEVQKLRQEVEELRGERKTVRTRIEKLLGQMDLLSGS